MFKHETLNGQLQERFGASERRALRIDVAIVIACDRRPTICATLAFNRGMSQVLGQERPCRARDISHMDLTHVK
jgi:hypothetical protein